MPTKVPEEEFIEVVERHGGNCYTAARDLGLKHSSVWDRWRRIKKKRAQKGEGTPAQVPEGYEVKGTSVLYDQDGNVRLTWVKTKQEAENLGETVRSICEGLLTDLRGRGAAGKAPRRTLRDYLSCYCIGDAHVGMYAWDEEAGENFDLNIAGADLCAAVDRMVEAAPASEEALIAQFGDFFHMDNAHNFTPQNNNPLDVDTRFHKVVKAGVAVMRYCVDRALEKHKIVRVRNVAGNHDPHSSLALTLALDAYYSRTKRVIVESSPAPLWYYRFGENLIGLAHGHAPKPEKLAGVLAVEARKDWDADFKMVWHGHIHHKREIEEMEVSIESFRTLAPRDAWHATQGYKARREMQVVVLHREDGEIERHTCGIRRARRGSQAGTARD